MFSKWAARLVISGIFLCAWPVRADTPQGTVVAPKETAPQGKDIAAAYRRIEESLVNRLSDPSIWSERRRRKELVEDLQAASVVRTPKVVPVLIQHLEFEPAFPSTRPLTIEMEYPVLAVLRDIGLPAAVPLVEEIKKPAGQKAREPLLLGALILVYEQGGWSRELCRVRLEQELPKCTPEQKKEIESALVLLNQWIELHKKDVK